MNGKDRAFSKYISIQYEGMGYAQEIIDLDKAPFDFAWNARDLEIAKWKEYANHKNHCASNDDELSDCTCGFDKLFEDENEEK